MACGRLGRHVRLQRLVSQAPNMKTSQNQRPQTTCLFHVWPPKHTCTSEKTHFWTACVTVRISPYAHHPRKRSRSCQPQGWQPFSMISTEQFCIPFLFCQLRARLQNNRVGCLIFFIFISVETCNLYNTYMCMHIRIEYTFEKKPTNTNKIKYINI
jgi:hypothetical protein